MREALARPGFRALFVGQAVSGLGDWMVTVALMVLVLQVSGSTAAVGGVLVLRLLPAMLAGPATARLIRRWDRRRTMMSMDLVRAGIVVLIPLVRGIWWIYLGAFALELCGLIFLPARDASVPDLAGDDVGTANGLVLASSFGTLPLGAAAFALLAALPGSSGRFPLLPVFVVDSVTFVVSYLLIRDIRELASEPARSRDVDGAPQESSSVRRAVRIPLVRAALPSAAVVALGLGSLFSLGTRFVRDVLHAGDTQFGVLIVLFGLGATLGLVSSSRAGPPTLRRLRFGCCAQGVTIAVMSQAPSIALAFLGAAVFGLATAFTLSTGMGYLQREVGGDDRVLAFSAFHVIIRGGLAVAALAAGIAADLVQPIRLGNVTLDPVRLVLGCAGVVVVLGALAIGRVDPQREQAPPSRQATT